MPCLGVFPYVHGIALDEEDGVSLDEGRYRGHVAIVRFPQVSNFNDFDRIAGAQWIDVTGSRLYDTVILPGHEEHHRRPAMDAGTGLDNGYSPACSRAH